MVKLKINLVKSFSSPITFEIIEKEKILVVAEEGPKAVNLFKFTDKINSEGIEALFNL